MNYLFIHILLIYTYPSIDMPLSNDKSRYRHAKNRITVAWQRCKVRCKYITCKLWRRNARRYFWIILCKAFFTITAWIYFQINFNCISKYKNYTRVKGIKNKYPLPPFSKYNAHPFSNIYSNLILKHSMCAHMVKCCKDENKLVSWVARVAVTRVSLLHDNGLIKLVLCRCKMRSHITLLRAPTPWNSRPFNKINWSVLRLHVRRRG